MNLTYTTTATGYTIYDNGTPWIVQDGYIPHPMPTMSESAEVHIDEIIASANIKPIDYEARLDAMQEVIDSLLLAQLEGGM